MAPFKSWNSYDDFSREVARQHRYMRTPDADDFLHAVAATCKARLHQMQQGTIFWRAQLGHSSQALDQQNGYEEDVAFGPSRMKPRREPSGRASEPKRHSLPLPVHDPQRSHVGSSPLGRRVGFSRSVPNRSYSKDSGLFSIAQPVFQTCIWKSERSMRCRASYRCRMKLILRKLCGLQSIRPFLNP